MNTVSKGLREIRVHFSPSSPASKGLRSFVLNKYASFKSSNPGLPVMVREAHNVESRIIARFEKGVEKKVNVDNLPEDEISKLFKTLVQ
ncbi:NADH dehydrogenase [ubiquinone] 1 alpha subcomplex subunit 2 [Smittium mucronatum]|uniref:NADH dehydrogenase [ubiquinone] 1 alpha subcomplex subunit 2 n=1 Tax=Smittium mucronatum TaxID=133383 RepID=A0A1R0GQZ4_9FUNG|nr:NADH dehydrogenase [ubiquinone] 1 alpha subcomplex subunit 2 [Smittium mucronatum]